MSAYWVTVRRSEDAQVVRSCGVMAQNTDDAVNQALKTVAKDDTVYNVTVRVGDGDTSITRSGCRGAA
jgi:hypothetical protein